MTDRFLQLHLLTFYPPSNPNRDESNRPKTCYVGNVERLRLSSQAIKHAVRKSEAFAAALDGYLGDRTLRFARKIKDYVIKKYSMPEAETLRLAKFFSELFGTADTRPVKASDALIKQLMFVSPQEQASTFAKLDEIVANPDLLAQINAAAGEIGLAEAELDDGDHEQIGPKSKNKPNKKKSEATTKLLKALRADVLVQEDHAVDIALFGRMFADSPGFNREAAAQVAHSFTTHAVTLDDDYYTAVDDLKKPEEEDAGAGFIGNLAFGSGVHYLYVCVDLKVLTENLGKDAPADLATTAIRAFVKALATTSPGGKRKAFGHNPRASYVMAERGNQQPRSLAIAFLKPVRGDDLMAKSIDALVKIREKLDAAYGNCAEHHRIFDAYGDETGGPHRVASLAALADFAAGA